MTERDYSDALAKNRRVMDSDLFWHGGPHDRIGCRDGIDPSPPVVRTTQQNLGEVAYVLSVEADGTIQIIPPDNHHESTTQ